MQTNEQNEQPAFKVYDLDGGHEYKIYANGMTEGWSGRTTITNRIPLLLAEATPASAHAMLDRIDQLETELGMKVDMPPEFSITRNMGSLLAMLLKREVVTREGALLAIYSGMPNSWDKEPDPKIIDVFICKLRARLKKYGIKVSCKWGLGYFMDATNKAKLRVLIADTRAKTIEGL